MARIEEFSPPGLEELREGRGKVVLPIEEALMQPAQHPGRSGVNDLSMAQDLPEQDPIGSREVDQVDRPREGVGEQVGEGLASGGVHGSGHRHGEVEIALRPSRSVRERPEEDGQFHALELDQGPAKGLKLRGIHGFDKIVRQVNKIDLEVRAPGGMARVEVVRISRIPASMRTESSSDLRCLRAGPRRSPFLRREIE